MVSAFTHERGEILGLKVMENKKQSEIVAVQDLLELLDLKGVVFTIDALHCQKSGCDPQRLRLRVCFAERKAKLC